MIHAYYKGDWQDEPGIIKYDDIGCYLDDVRYNLIAAKNRENSAGGLIQGLSVYKLAGPSNLASDMSYLLVLYQGGSWQEVYVEDFPSLLTVYPMVESFYNSIGEFLYDQTDQEMARG